MIPAGVLKMDSQHWTLNCEKKQILHVFLSGPLVLSGKERMNEEFQGMGKCSTPQKTLASQSNLDLLCQ